MKVKFNIKLTDGQKEGYKLCHDKDNKIVVLCFSRQCGKTVLCEILLIEQLFKANTYSAYISPTFQLGRKVYKEILQLLEQTNIVAKANSSTLTIETVFGSTLQFFSAESPQAIRGTTVSGLLIIDEAAYIKDVLPNGEDFWGNVVMPITKARRPRVILVSTPAGMSGFYFDFYQRALNGEEGIVALKRTIYDDNLVTPQEIEEIKRTIPNKAWQQEFECVFLASSLTFFDGFEKCFGKYQYQPNQRTWIGIDLSAQGEDETILTKIDEDNRVRQYKILGTLDSRYRQIADIINNTQNLTAIYAENNGLGAPMINEIRKLIKHRNKLHEWTTTNSSKEEIISNLAVIIANKGIYFNEEDKELFSQFSTFICKISKTKKLTFGAKEGFHDDRILSLAIALKAKEDNKQSPTLAFLQGNDLTIR